MKIPLLSLVAVFSSAAFLSGAELRLGIIGTDTSHVVAFTKLLNHPEAPGHVAGARVVGVVKAHSDDIPSSFERAAGFEATLEKEGVRFYETIPALCAQVDGVLVESVDGRPHLEQARQVIAAGKPLFVDKPIGGTLRDAVEIFRLARAAGVSVFTSSAYRFYDSLVELRKTEIGEVRSAISYGPASLEPHHPDLFWYGVHPTEALFTVMGRGCETVMRTTTQDTDVVVGTWKGGRVGVLHAVRTKPQPHRVLLFGSNGFAEQKAGGDSYAPLLGQIVQFFQSGVAPVSPAETIEMFGFMEAADESKRRGGAPVGVGEVLAAAGYTAE